MKYLLNTSANYLNSSKNIAVSKMITERSYTLLRIKIKFLKYNLTHFVISFIFSFAPPLYKLRRKTFEICIKFYIFKV